MEQIRASYESRCTRLLRIVTLYVAASGRDGHPELADLKRALFAVFQRWSVWKRYKAQESSTCMLCGSVCSWKWPDAINV